MEPNLATSPSGISSAGMVSLRPHGGAPISEQYLWPNKRLRSQTRTEFRPWPARSQLSHLLSLIPAWTERLLITAFSYLVALPNGPDRLVRLEGLNAGRGSDWFLLKSQICFEPGVVVRKAAGATQNALRYDFSAPSSVSA